MVLVLGFRATYGTYDCESHQCASSAAAVLPWGQADADTTWRQR